MQFFQVMRRGGFRNPKVLNQLAESAVGRIEVAVSLGAITTNGRINEAAHDRESMGIAECLEGLYELLVVHVKEGLGSLVAAPYLDSSTTI